MKERINAVLDRILAENESSAFSDLTNLAITFKAEDQTQKAVYDAFLDVYSARIVVDGTPIVSEPLESSLRTLWTLFVDGAAKMSDYGLKVKCNFLKPETHLEDSKWIV